MSSGSFLYPNVTSVPRENPSIDSNSRIKKDKDAGPAGEFGSLLDQTISDQSPKSDLDQIRSPLKFSGHATQRLKDRKIALDPATLAKVNIAIDQAEAKGVEDALVLTKDAALIVNVRNRTVITAMDRDSLSGNVFTNIDGAVIV